MIPMGKPFRLSIPIRHNSSKGVSYVTQRLVKKFALKKIFVLYFTKILST